MVNRYPRHHFTAVLFRVCARLDKHSEAEVAWSDRFFHERHCQMTVVRKIWVFGSYARGATDCGDLDLIVEIAAEKLPPRSAVFRTFFGSAPDVRIYLGTPVTNGSGLEVSEALLIWNGPGHDWRESIARIRENPDATRFKRPLDRLPFRSEQLSVPPSELEEIVSAEQQGVIKWAMSPLPRLLEANQLGPSGERFMRHVSFAGKKTQQIAKHVLSYMRPREHWFGSTPTWNTNRITWGGCEILMGNPYVPIHWLDRLNVFELVIVPHISRRGPNGIWSIARGNNHPLMKRLEGVEFFIFGWNEGSPGNYMISIEDMHNYHEANLVELYRTEEAANRANNDWGTDDPMVLHRISGENLLAVLASADIISIDAHCYAKSSYAAAAYDLDEVTTDEALLDLIASNP